MFRNSNKMKVLLLKHLLFLVSAIITGRADVIPERTRRDGNQVPVGGKVGAYGSSSVNPNTDAQLSAEIGEGGAFIDNGLQTPNGLGGLNEVGESFGVEGKAGYNGEGQFNGGNIVDEYGLAPSSAGFGYGNQFKTVAQASASAEVYTGKTAVNGGTAPADTTTQAKLRAPFGQGVQHDKGTKVQTSYHPIMPLNELMNAGPEGNSLLKKHLSLSSDGPGYLESFYNPGNRPVYIFTTPPPVPYGGTFIGIPQVDTDLSQAPFGQGVQHDKGIKVQTSYHPIMPLNELMNAGPEGDSLLKKYLSLSSDGPGYLESKKFKPMANTYTGEWITQSPNSIKKALLYNNLIWNPYTKPTQAETLVQTDRKIEADALAQEKGEPQYQKQTQVISIVQRNKGVEAIAANADAETKTNAGYGGQYNAETQPGVMAQINSESKYETSTLADAVVQSSGGVQYSGENKLTSSAQADAEFQPNIAYSYNGGTRYAVPHYVGVFGSESAPYLDTGIYNHGSQNGEGFQSNVKSHLQSEVQFGGAVGAEAVAQPGIVVETRFGQSTHPPRRPMPGFGYRHPYNVRNHG